MEKRFWYPAINTNFCVCPCAYRLDTYKGCVFNCSYCYARKITNHCRSKSKKWDDNHSFNKYLVKLDYEKFERWCDRINKSSYEDLNNIAYKIAFKDRVALRIGCMSDPFPYIECEEKATYNTLKILNKYDYPVIISTKNPEPLIEYYKDFKKPNWIIACSAISIDDCFNKSIELNAPLITNRLKAIKELNSLGANTIIRLQPLIYPYHIKHAKEIINYFSTLGIKGIILETLKINSLVTEQEKKFINILNKQLGYDIIEYFKECKNANHGTFIYSNDIINEMIDKYIELCKEYKLKAYVGENSLRCKSCSNECCGTEYLNNYNTFLSSPNIMNCKADFIYSYNKSSQKKYKELTVKEYLKFKKNNIYNIK